MNDNLPPLPMKSLLYETRDRFDDPLHINGYTAEQMQAYARATLAAAPQPQPVQQFELTEYDAGLLNDFGGGNVEWWQDYIRAELGRAYEHYQSQIPAPQPQPVPPAQPPSDEQIADAYEATVSIQNHLTWAAYRAGARYAETQHGITKGKT